MKSNIIIHIWNIQKRQAYYLSLTKAPDSSLAKNLLFFSSTKGYVVFPTVYLTAW